MAQHQVLLDTSFILALENRKDPHHERAKSLDRDLFKANAVYVVHWGIMIEVADGYARLERRAKGLQFSSDWSRRIAMRTTPSPLTFLTVL